MGASLLRSFERHKTEIAGTIVFFLLFHFFWLTFQAGLWRPWSAYNDSNYHTLLGASATFNGEYFPRFAHPGTSFMLLLSWFLAALRSIGVLQAFSYTDFQQAGEPLVELLNLLQLAKWFNVGLIILYGVLIVLIAKRLTQSVFVGCVLLVFSCVHLGLLENTFIIRSELFSVICVAAAWLSYLRDEAGDFNKQLRLLVVMGFWVAMGLAAKVLVVVFFPLVLLALFKVGKRLSDKEYEAQKFLRVTLVCLGLFLILLGPWLPIFSQTFLSQYTPAHHLNKLQVCFGVLKGSALVLGCFFAAFLGLAFFKRLPVKFTKVMLCSLIVALALAIGVLLAQALFFMNGTAEPLAHAHRLVVTSWIETFHFSFFERAFIDRPASVSIAFLWNPEIRDLFSGKFLYLFLGVAGWGVASKKERVHLALLWGLVFFLGYFLALRGGANPVFYYSIYGLFTLSILAALNLKYVFRQGGRYQVGVVLVLMVLAGASAVRTHQGREQMFRMTLFDANEFDRLAYWERGNFLTYVLSPKYCQGQDEANCREQMNARFLAAKKAY